MSLEDFQLEDKEAIGSSIIKRDFLEKYQQQAAKLKVYYQTFEFTFVPFTGGSDIEHNKYAGQISTSMRILISEDGDLLSHFDEIDESRNKNTSLENLLINNHDVSGDRIKGNRPLILLLDFVEHFKNHQTIRISSDIQNYGSTSYSLYNTG